MTQLYWTAVKYKTDQKIESINCFGQSMDLMVSDDMYYVVVSRVLCNKLSLSDSIHCYSY